VRRLVFNMRDERPVWAPPAWVVDRLRAELPRDFELLDVAAPVSGRGDGGGLSDEAVQAVRGAEIYFGLGLPRELLLTALETPSRLRWIHTGAAGVASLLHRELVEGDVVLTNSAGVHAEPIAETVLGMILHFARGLDFAVRGQHQREWRADLFENVSGGVREIDGAALGVIGYGGIGRAVARRAVALGMHVRALRRGRTENSGPGEHTDRRHDGGGSPAGHAATAASGAVAMVSGDGALDDVLRDSDFLVLSLPSTPATRGMIGARELALMKPDAVLINVARGDVVDEDSLIDVLSARRLRGAGLDVFTTEPLPADSALWSLDNVLVTPHVSATSPRFWEREAELLLRNLRSYLTGEPLRNVVDTVAGY
jgi:phosphoglycerate dehydrogenase-like enzyme